MSVFSKEVNGNIVYYQEGNEARWLDAIGPTVQKWEMRVGTDFSTGHEFTQTVVSVGDGDSLISQAITIGDKARLLTAANENDGAQIQVVGTPFQLVSGKPLYFGARLSVSDATQSDLLIGLASLDTALLTSHAVAIADDGVYFYKLDAGTALLAAAEKAGTVVTAAISSAMGTAKATYEFLWDGQGSLDFFYNGSLVSTMTSGYPTVVLSPSFAFNNGEAAAKTGLIEWMRCIQIN